MPGENAISKCIFVHTFRAKEFTATLLDERLDFTASQVLNYIGNSPLAAFLANFSYALAHCNPVFATAFDKQTT